MDHSSVKRRLTCILAADAVGYSKQMSQDEEGTIRVLSAHRAVIDGILTFHQGRIVSTAGDSVLAEFSSAVEDELLHELWDDPLVLFSFNQQQAWMWLSHDQRTSIPRCAAATISCSL